MTRITAIVLINISLVCIALTPLRAQENAAVEAAVALLTKAMVAADSATLQRLTAPELTYGHSNGHVENRQAFIQSLVEGKYRFLTITTGDQQITRKGELAIVRHTFSATTQDKGMPVLNIRLHVMLVWQNTPAGWILVGRQSVKYPVQ